MRFASDQPLVAAGSQEATFTGARLLVAAYLTEPAAVEENLPCGFAPTEQPLVTVFVAEYPQTNFGTSYRESALLVSCKYGEEKGALCLGIVVDDDIALILGREIFGYPKKLAQISLERSGSRVVGKVSRRGVQFLEIRAELGEAIASPAVPAMGPTFLVKAFPAADLQGLEWPPKVVASPIGSQPRSLRPALSCEVVLQESELDRWAAFPVKDVVFGAEVETQLSMAPGRVLGELDPASWLPYLATNLR